MSTLIGAILSTALSIAFGVLYRGVVWDLVIPWWIPRRLRKIKDKKRKRFFRKIRRLLNRGIEVIGPTYFIPTVFMFLGGYFLDEWARAGIEFGYIGYHLVSMTLGFFVGSIIGLSPVFALRKDSELNQRWKPFDFTPRLQTLGVRALVEDKSVEGRILLSNALSTGNKEFIRFTVEELAANKDPWGTPILADALRVTDPDIQIKALNGLAETEPEQLQDRLKPLLVNENPAVREAAYGFIHLLKAPDARRYLTKGVRDKVPQVRKEAALAAQRVESIEEVKWIDSMLDYATHVEYALELRALREELFSGSWQSVKAARQAMGEVGKWEELLPLVEKIKEFRDDPVLVPVLLRLKEKDDAESRRCMLLLLGEAEPKVRETAITLLRSMNIQSLMLKKYLESKRGVEMAGAIHILGAKDQATTFDPMLKFLEINEAQVRVAAIEEIAHFEPDERLKQPFRKLIKDPHPEVRAAVYAAIVELGDMRMLEILVEAHRQPRKSQGERNNLVGGIEETVQVRKAIKDLIDQQPFTGQSVPELLCTRCLTRTVETKQLTFRYPVCRRCSQSDALIPGVKAVRGVIGTGFEPGKLNAGVFTVDLWNEKLQQTRYADATELVIRGGGDFDYDWAVNAVVEALQNGSADHDLHLRVVHEANPNISQNTLKLLNRIKPEVSPS